MEKIKQLVNSTIFKIILIALFIRLLGINYPYIAEESTWARLNNIPVNYALHNAYNPYSADQYLFMHPPLTALLWKISTYLFGINAESIRMVPVLFGIGLIYVCYLFSKKLYDEKTATITGILLAVSFFPIWSSLYIDLDGSVLSFLVAAAIYNYFNFYASGKQDKNALYLAALFFGLALLTKYTAILIIAILFLIELYGAIRRKEMRLRDMRRDISPIFGIIFLGLIVFSIFPLIMILNGNAAGFLGTVFNGTNLIATDTSGHNHNMLTIFVSFAKNIFFILQYALPMILLLALTALRKRKPEEAVLFFWIAVFFIFYTVMITEGGKVRYLAILIPPLYMLSAKSISEIFSDIKKKELVNLIVSSALFLTAIIILNKYGTVELFGLQNMDPKIVLQNGLLWYSGRGSASFMVHIHSFIFVVALSAVLFAISFKQRYFKNAILLIIALNIAFNFFILSESFYPTIGPQYELTLKGLARDYGNSTGQLYGVLNYCDALNIYFGDSRLDYYSPGKNGTVMIINMQLFEDPKSKEYIMANCNLEKTYYSNNYPYAYVYNC